MSVEQAKGKVARELRRHLSRHTGWISTDNGATRSDCTVLDVSPGGARVVTDLGIDPSTGEIENALTDNFWYDAAGNVIKRLPSGSQLFIKSTYDGIARKRADYFGYYTGEGDEPVTDVPVVTGEPDLFSAAILVGGNSGPQPQFDHHS